MGKRQHQKDKMYLTATEWATLYGGKRPTPASGEGLEFRRLPFDHCCISLQPYESPLCDADGNIFDLSSIVPFLKKYKTNPITGKPLDAKSLTLLNMFKNSDGKYHCPVMYRVFNNNTYIVAIKSTGNVFCYEAVEELNVKPRNWKELLTDEPFKREDIIVIQDPTNLQKFNFASFHHLKHNLKVEDEETKKSKNDPKARLKTVSVEATETLKELKDTFKEPEKPAIQAKKVADKFNAAHYSTGAVAHGLTSTVMDPVMVHEAAIVDEDDVRYERIKKKGYVRLVTNFGPLNLELNCEAIPIACENFIKLCNKGYYNGTKFHRSIRNFMIQGGDPTGKGTGGESIWGKPFKDEFKPNLTHTGRGILSMANSGTDTNQSQFFITYRSCKHLDNKHTVFGRVVGGLETLSAIEKIEVDNKDRPIEDIVLMNAQVFVDPYDEVDEQLAALRAEEAKKQQELSSTIRKKANDKLQIYGSGVGKYINMKDKSSTTKDKTLETSLAKKKVAAKPGHALTDFSAW